MLDKFNWLKWNWKKFYQKKTVWMHFTWNYTHTHTKIVLKSMFLCLRWCKSICSYQKWVSILKCNFVLNVWIIIPCFIKTRNDNTVNSFSYLKFQMNSVSKVPVKYRFINFQWDFCFFFSYGWMLKLSSK